MLRFDLSRTAKSCGYRGKSGRHFEICIFGKSVYDWQITPALFKSNTLMTLVLFGKDCEYLLGGGSYFFLANTFKSCSRQFVCCMAET
jgi:hypothetical protein